MYRHNLTTTLETAIRSSNAEKDPADVLRRLDARMLEYTRGEIGWDVFSLEYKVDAPLDTVLDPGSMERYLRVFRYLWQLKRIETVLERGWMRLAGGRRNFLHVPELGLEWHKIRICMAEMIHFIRQLQAYCHVDVIECSWKALVDFLNKKEGDLDALIESHRSYLDRILKKILLLSPKIGKEEMLLMHVRDAFSTILQYREATDNFYNYCLSESSRRDEEFDNQRGVVTARTRRGRHDSAEVLDGMLDRVREYGASFSERVQVIVHHLQVHSDLDCRFLGIRLSFSEHYKTKKDSPAKV